MKRHRIFWLTGLPCSGKTTIAGEITRQIHAHVIDGDDLRGIVDNPDFSPEGRRRNVLTVAEMAHRISEFVPVVVALVSPIREVRDTIKARYPQVCEVFIDTPLPICIRRDVKGMYGKALAGQLPGFTGIGSAYEEPEDALAIETIDRSVAECATEILRAYPVKRGPYSLFIGRWQPLHAGHLAIFDAMRREGRRILIGIRDTGLDEANPYTVSERIAMIREQVPDAEVLVMPDIDAVCYGRKVGYEIRRISLDDEIEAISATSIRKAAGTPVSAIS